MATARRPAGAPPRLPWTGDPEADRLISDDPLALLIGFVLDQQVTVQKAMSGPRVIRDRLGTLDAARLAAIEPARLGEAFATPPAIHRYPLAMARRVQALCSLVAERHGGDASAIWRGAGSAAELFARLRALPGFGPMKATTVVLVLARRFGVRPDGWEAYQPQWMTLADCDTADRLAEYQARKRAHKAELRAAAAAAGGGRGSRSTRPRRERRA